MTNSLNLDKKVFGPSLPKFGTGIFLIKFMARFGIPFWMVL